MTRRPMPAAWAAAPVVLALFGTAVTAVRAAGPLSIRSAAIDGASLTIDGSNFGDAVPSVRIGDTDATVTRNTDTRIEAVVTLAPGLYPMVVSTPGCATADCQAVGSLLVP